LNGHEFRHHSRDTAERLALRLGLVPLPIVDMLFGSMKARMIMVGVTLGLFEALRNEPHSAVDLAASTWPALTGIGSQKNVRRQNLAVRRTGGCIKGVTGGAKMEIPDEGKASQSRR
jgi:hypothetical protein